LQVKNRAVASIRKRIGDKSGHAAPHPKGGGEQKLTHVQLLTTGTASRRRSASDLEPLHGIAIANCV